jgi:Rps23 Pro-64 3,4-dihydroxylase Tpa1-like proline 4-hydroxylase
MEIKMNINAKPAIDMDIQQKAQNYDFLVEAIEVFNSNHYPEMAVQNAKKYQTAAPFPHISIPDFLPQDLALAARDAFPKADDIPWYTSDHDKARKRYQFEDRYIPPLLRSIVSAFSSSRFLLFLEELTGIPSLIPDPHMIGGGMHLVQTGGLLEVHADFNWYHKMQLHRRVNALWYLSDDWDDAWGGALEFWDPKTRKSVDAAFPYCNSLAVFSTGSDSLHGQPLPLATPEGKFRRALNFYYYTSAPIPGDSPRPTWTKYLSNNESGSHEVKAEDPYAVEASPFAASLRDRFLEGVSDK